MRADRLLSVLLLLQVHRRMTARELANRLEVSERTIHRDMESLSAAGFPVFAERGIGGGCDPVERLVDPLGLVAKGSVWYLVAGVEGQIRSYRVSRVSGAAMTEVPCTRPKGFDLASYWEQSAVSFKARLPQYQAMVRVHPASFPVMRYAGRFARIGQASEPDSEGWLTVPLRFDVEEMAIEYALSFGSKMEVLEPETLREKVISAAESVIAFYAELAPYERPVDRNSPLS